jgi:cellulose synthase/poly-beta-1,6-N-acetylglucosamine synthase-like glycosyltransferase
VPAYNEAVGIARAVTSLAGSRSPNVEVIVVDDGSTDGTAAVVRALRLPNVLVIEQDNQGKPAALNAGVDASSGEIVVMVDGDTVFQPDTLSFLVQPFIDPSVGAVAGNTKVANRRRLLGRWQHIEYVMGFNLDRRMYEQLRCMPTVPGAIGAFDGPRWPTSVRSAPTHWLRTRIRRWRRAPTVRRLLGPDRHASWSARWRTVPPER